MKRSLQISTCLADGKLVTVEVGVSGKPVHGESQIVLDTAHKLLSAVKELRDKAAK